MNILTKKRVKLTRSVLEDFHQNAAKNGLSSLCRQTGLPYGLLYNVAHGRVKTISIRDYRMIFNKDPIVQLPDRKDGAYFRDMVKLWLFLNNGQSENGLYQEFFRGKKAFKKTDYRIFTGEIDTVDSWLEDRMEEKFLAQGLDRRKIQDWIAEFQAGNRKKRVPFPEIKPILQFIQDTVGIHPAGLLKQSLKRYETGNLHTVSSQVFEKAVRLKTQIQHQLDTKQSINTEKLRNRILGIRPGFVPFYEIEDKLDFLREFGGHYPKKYLGRGIGYYKKKKIKHVAQWRIAKIDKDCRDIIREEPDLPLSFLPKAFREEEIGKLLSILKRISIQQVCDDNDAEFEEDIIKQITLTREQYFDRDQGLVRFDEAARYLKMKQKAFDYMVANHSGLFKKIAVRKEQGWYIPDIYLDTLKKVSGFALIKGKYNFLVSHKNECRPSCCLSVSEAVVTSGSS